MLQPCTVMELSGGEDELCAQRREVRLVRLMQCSGPENPENSVGSSVFEFSSLTRCIPQPNHSHLKFKQIFCHNG